MLMERHLPRRTLPGSPTIMPHQMVGRSTVAAITSMLVVAGCSSSTAPMQPPPTLLVTNALCAVAPCRTLEIRAFVWAFQIPQPPVGIKVLGYARGPTTCLEFPPQWTFGGGSSDGGTTWTPNNPAGIYLVAQDSAFVLTQPTQAQIDSSVQGLWPYDGELPGSLGTSPTFVPGTAPGWTITFPFKTQSGAAEPALTPTAACTP